MSVIEIQEPEISAHIANIPSKMFFHILQQQVPSPDSQHVIVSMRAGMNIPRKEKNMAPTNEMNGSSSGTNMATLTKRENLQMK